MNARKPYFWLMACFVVVALAGCRRTGRMDDRDRNYRIVVKAYEMSNQGEYDAAIALFSKALEAYPKLARPHLDLAILLQERQLDHVRAIYHYSRYMELRPGSEKEDMIESRIRQSELAFVAIHAKQTQRDRVSVRELETMNNELRIKNNSLGKRVRALERELDVLRETQRQRYKAEVVGGDAAVAEPLMSSPSSAEAPIALVAPPSSAEAPVETPTPPEPQPEVVPSTPDISSVAIQPPERAETPLPARPTSVAPVRRSAPVPARETITSPPAPVTAVPVVRDPVVRTYTVRRGDSLSKIAFKVYGDATQWRSIQNANRESLGESVNVKVGQVLIIP
ncbi:MAG: LysM peptidoglycan-binding domain-containing protein [Verrucomicrobia bacterium]|jgi:nucleoid-associated protein YgaU|nr:LysM peptidoglycan-binding domain-containing protein [Verrucomicrobiota bacterium]